MKNTDPFNPVIKKKIAVTILWHCGFSINFIFRSILREDENMRLRTTGVLVQLNIGTLPTFAALVFTVPPIYTY